MVQCLGLGGFTAEGPGSIPGQGTKNPASRVAWPKKKSVSRNCNPPAFHPYAGKYDVFSIFFLLDSRSR